MVFPNGDPISILRGQINAAHAKIQEQARQVQQVQGQNALLRQQLGVVDAQMQNLASLVNSTQQVNGGNGGGGAPLSPVGIGLVKDEDRVMYINEIPGRRIPFDVLVSIPIGANVTSAEQQSATISQDGPFVAVARFAAFQSNFTFTKTIDSSVFDFQGRSNGRFRPIHSMWDLNDSQIIPPVAGLANPGTGGPIYASPTNHSGFRTMEFDGVIEFLNEGAGYFRHNNPVPTAFWTNDINSAFQLAALDFFERGETMQFKVTPNHINNPQGGNVSGFMPGGVFPTLASQYDVHEGILDEYDSELTADPVARTPQGIFIVGFHGLKILQPPGPVRMV
jgi:hypothetical protein